MTNAADLIPQILADKGHIRALKAEVEELRRTIDALREDKTSYGVYLNGLLRGLTKERAKLALCALGDKPLAFTPPGRPTNFYLPY